MGESELQEALYCCVYEQETITSYLFTTSFGILRVLETSIYFDPLKLKGSLIMKCNIRSPLLSSLLLFFYFSMSGQVQNSSYENYTSCPTSPSMIGNIVDWRAGIWPVTTPDAFNACSNNIQTRVPDNTVAFQFPSHGNGYVGIMVFANDTVSSFFPEYREAVEGKLTNMSSLGDTVIFCMRYAIGDKCKLLIDSLQVYFGPQIGAHSIGSYPNVSPQISFAVNPDTLGWSLVCDTFVASGDEEYIYVTNFQDDASTGYSILDSTSLKRFAYVLLDSLSLVIHPVILAIEPGDTIVIEPEPQAEFEILKTTYYVLNLAGQWILCGEDPPVLPRGFYLVKEVHVIRPKVGNHSGTQRTFTTELVRKIFVR